MANAIYTCIDGTERKYKIECPTTDTVGDIKQKAAAKHGVMITDVVEEVPLTKGGWDDEEEDDTDEE